MNERCIVEIEITTASEAEMELGKNMEISLFRGKLYVL
jgi:hypothetical protein